MGELSSSYSCVNPKVISIYPLTGVVPRLIVSSVQIYQVIRQILIIRVSLYIKISCWASYCVSGSNLLRPSLRHCECLQLSNCSTILQEFKSQLIYLC